MIRRAAVIGLMMLSTGCTVATRGALSAPIEPWPPVAEAGTLPSISLAIEHVAEGTGSVGTSLATWRDDTVRAYRESGYFSEVVAGLQPKDLRGDIVIRSKSGANRTNVFLCGLTFGLIPLVETKQLKVETHIRRTDGSELSLENSGAVRLWAQLLLLPLSVFSPKASTLADAVVYDLNRATLLQARTQLTE